MQTCNLFTYHINLNTSISAQCITTFWGLRDSKGNRIFSPCLHNIQYNVIHQGLLNIVVPVYIYAYFHRSLKGVFFSLSFLQRLCSSIQEITHARKLEPPNKNRLFIINKFLSNEQGVLSIRTT